MYLHSCMGERTYSSLVSGLPPSSFVFSTRPATMVKPRFTIDVQTFTNLLLLVVPRGAVYFWTRGGQLDEEAMAAKMPKGMGIVLCCTRYVSRCLGIVLHDGVALPEGYTFRGCVLPPSTCLLS